MATTRLYIKHAAFGLDLGQSGDPSALAAVLAIESVTSPFSWVDPTHPRHLTWQLSATHTFSLGTAYTKVAQQVQQSIQAFKHQHPATPCTLVADATGLGRPTLEILHHELSTSRQGPPVARLEGIVFTSGATHGKSQHPALPVDIFNIPKLDLIQNLLHAMESGHLTLAPNLENLPALRNQFKALRYATHHQTGNTTIQLATSPDPNIGHADLVMALSLASWRLRDLCPHRIQEFPKRLPGF